MMELLRSGRVAGGKFGFMVAPKALLFGTAVIGERFLDMSSQPRQILIVEDDLIVASELATVLAQEGHEILGPVADGLEALKLAGGSHPTIAVIDLNLAGAINGLTVARHLVEKFNVRVVFVSGHIGEVVREGMDLTRHFISKPFSDEAVIDAVREIVATLPPEPPVESPQS